MPAWTLEEARARLQMWLDAEAAVATGQSYQIGTRNLTRANLNQIREEIQMWRREVVRLESQQNGKSFPRSRRVVLRDI